MTERIDHADEARRFVAETIDGLAEGDIDDSMAGPAVAMAQVHATLALVEQQRIANLIAYAADVDVIRDGNYDVNVSIRKALGLT